MSDSIQRSLGNFAVRPTAGNLWIAVVLILFLSFGCSPKMAPMSDSAQAKELLKKMLDEWKSGTSLGELKKRNPPVYFTEDLWRNGATLNDYVMTEESDALGSNIRFQVKLKCTNKGGKAIEKPVRYIVTTQPALTIVREEG